jgi:hypothetical protein
MTQSNADRARAIEAEATRAANEAAKPVIRSMYPMRSRGQMANEFRHFFIAGAHYYRDTIDAELSALRAANACLVAGLEYYAHQSHFENLEEWDTVSGEPTNWIVPPDDREEMIENGGIARESLARARELLGGKS